MAGPGRAVIPTWRKSKYSEAGNCVEVAREEGAILIRSSDDPAKLISSVTIDAWRSFLFSIKGNNLGGL